jgi:hypothetical protein
MHILVKIELQKFQYLQLKLNVAVRKIIKFKKYATFSSAVDGFTLE